MNLKQKLNNISRCFSSITSWVIFTVTTLILAYTFLKYTNFTLIRGNLGEAYAFGTILSETVISILFGLNITLLYSKLLTAHKVNKKEFGGTTLGSILGLLVIGCPLCNITLASFLGLGAFVTVLPLFGMELKILGIAMLLYSTNSLSK